MPMEGINTSCAKKRLRKDMKQSTKTADTAKIMRKMMMVMIVVMMRIKVAKAVRADG